MNTEECLKEALAGEAQARAKYHAFASVAKKEGLGVVWKIFEETAENEFEHSKMIMKLLGIIGDTRKNLQTATDGENYEWQKMYPSFAAVAKTEGKKPEEAYFSSAATVEKTHAARYQFLLDSLKAGTLFKSGKPVAWRCENCGYVHFGTEAPKECPLCKHPEGYFWNMELKR